jgi:omega-amidase
MQLAVVQMLIQDAEPEINRKTFSDLLAQEVNHADLYLLPELWTDGYVNHQWNRLADEEAPKTCIWMSEKAAQYSIWLAGTIVMFNSTGQLVNRFLMYDRSGNLACSYDKAHLFRPMQEDQFLMAGACLPSIIHIDGFNVAPVICYDLRFPEMFRRLTLKGADVFLLCSQWPFPRENVLKVLTQARAMENQVFLAVANRVGKASDGIDFCGESGIFSPTSQLISARQEVGIFSSKLDKHYLSNLRNDFPVLTHRLQGVDYD